MRWIKLVLLVSSFFLIWSCKKGETHKATVVPSTSFKLSSTEFADSGALPKIHTCDSSGSSPSLYWENAPVGTQSYLVTMHHIPGPGDKHVYIVLYNIPASVGQLAAGTTGIGNWGANTVNGLGAYTPPCSQGPGIKWYTLTVYALSAPPTLSFFTIPSLDAVLGAVSAEKLDSATINVSYTRY